MPQSSPIITTEGIEPMSDLREASRDLVLERLLAAPRAALWRCWSEADLLKRWFAPAPWSVPEASLDFRPGGESFIVMRGPQGEEFPSRGVYLEIDPGRRLVFTDAYTAGWRPSAKPFFTGILTFEDAPGGTRYVARALHWSEEDRAAHEKMGFHEGWGKCADQLEALARTLD
jgi:uncharacterized protein YndB with AHSA1/START domain